MLLKKLKNTAFPNYLRIIILLGVLQASAPFYVEAQCISGNEIQLTAICTGNGLALLKGSTPKGGTGNFTYAWEKNSDGNCSPNGFVRIPGATGQDYIISSTRDADVCYRRIVFSGNCTHESNRLNINLRDIPAVGTVPAAPQASAQHPQNCSQATGSITVTAVSGAQYSINATQYQQSNVFSNLAPGTYRVTIKNSAGCVSPATSVTINPAPSAPAAPQASAQNPQNCSQTTGSITVTAVSGAQYSINGTQYQQSNVFSNVAPGTYSVTIKNSTGCVSPATSITVNPPPSAPAAPQALAQHPQSCSQSTGSITVTAVSGAQYSINGAQYQQSNVFSNVATGTYNVTVRNSAGCVSPATAVTVNPPPSAPSAPQASAQHPQSCSQSTGSITVTAVAGAQYSINGTQYQQSNVFSNVAPGVYTVTVRNSAGCVSPATSLTVNPAASAPVGSIIPTSVSICEGRSQVLAANGGTSYQWKRDGVDIPGATSSTYAATLAGTYTVTIRNGTCTGLAANSAVVRVQACIIIGESKVFVPEAFTPDRNNTNDELKPYFKNVTELKYFKVFNRWGQMVFQTNIIGTGWNGNLKGQPQPSETYSWMLEYIDHNGKPARLSGTSILVR